MDEKYPMTHDAKMDIANRFVYHSPQDDQPKRYEAIRSKAKELATLIATSCPPSREKSLAMTNLEEAVMWANASIARNEDPYFKEHKE